jgi:acetyl esterase/lipase
MSAFVAPADETIAPGVRISNRFAVVTSMSFSLVGLLNLITRKSGRSQRVAAGLGYGPSRKQKLDLYAPRSGAGPWPVIVFFYGGAWAEGDRWDFGFVGRWLAAQGHLVAVADYRAIPEVEYPVFLEDCAAAVRWVLEHAAGYGGDAKRLALAGHSAGAYNAVMVALDARYGLAGKVAAVVGLSGPYDFFPFDVPISIRTFSAAPDPAGTQPINLVTAGAPPMLLASGDDDTLVGPANTRALAAKLREAGVEVVERHYPGFKHPATLLELGTPLGGRSDLAQVLLAFLARHLATGIRPTVGYDRAQARVETDDR